MANQLKSTGLSQQTVHKIHAVLAKSPAIEKVVLYGSRAIGNYKHGSDIDITLFGTDLTLSNSVYPLEEALDELYFPYTFDISIFADLTHAKLREHIERVGLVFYKKMVVKWKKMKLGDVCKMYQPKTISAKEMLDDGEYPVYGANGVIGRYNKYNHEKKQLLVTCRGATCGSVNVSVPFAWINGNAMVIQPNPNDLSLRYTEYLFRGGMNLTQAITGAAQPQITRQLLSPIQVSYPPLAEQKAIVAKLDAAFAEIDKAIAAAERKQEEVDKLKQALLASELGIDAEAVKLGDVCVFQSGLWKGKKEPFTKANVIRSTNFTASGKLSFDDVAELYIEVKQLEKRQLEFGDIILEKAGGGDKTPVGRVCIFEEKHSETPYSLSNFTSLIRIKDKELLDCYYLHKVLFFMYISGKTEPMQRHSTGIRNLQITQYKDIQILAPPLAEQKAIVAKLDAAFAEIDNITQATNKQVENYQALKSVILAKELQARQYERS